MNNLITFDTNTGNLRVSPSHCYLSPKQVSWDSEHGTNESLSPVSLVSSPEQLCLLQTPALLQKAYLKLKVPPENRFRYRYDTEMSGTHGSLPGIKSGREKAVPTVELCNYVGEAFIRVRLTTCTEDRHPHPHSLFVKEKVFQKNYYPAHVVNKTRTGHYSDPLYVRVGHGGGDNVARFEGMCIISSKKETFMSCIRKKLEMLNMEKQYDPCYHFKQFGTSADCIDRKVEEVHKEIDVDFVSLCFEAFRLANGNMISLCPPVYSEPIANAKSAKTGKLKIVKINQCSGSCRGGDEIWLLVEKINKDGLVIKFYETNEQGVEVWESVIEENKLELHHQYAIIFTTPEYRDVSSFVEVKMRLERRKNNNYDCSEPVTFVYVPHLDKQPKDDLFYKESIITQPKIGQNKRARTDSSSVICNNNKRRNDLTYELDMSVTLEDEPGITSHPDILEILEEGGRLSSWELFSKLTDRSMLEELLGSLANEDVDMRLAKDGTTQHLLNLLAKQQQQQQLAGADVSKSPVDVKKLIEKINSTMFIEQDKKRLKDAASTLLSLRKTVVKPEIDDETQDKMLVHKAIKSDKCNIVEELLDQGYSVSSVDTNGNTVLHLAVLQHCDSCLGTLLGHDKSPLSVFNDEGLTPLHLAVKENFTRGVELLLKHEPDVFIQRQRTGDNCLHMAVAEGHVDCARILLRHSNSLVGVANRDGYTPLHLACVARHQLTPAIVQLLLEFSADPYKPCKARVTEHKDKNCFELAAKNPEVLKLLNSTVVKSQTLDDDTKDRLCSVLNRTGGWNKLVENWKFSFLTPHAKQSKNPTKYVLNYYETDSDINIEELKSLLHVVNEPEAVEVLNQTPARKLHTD